ncbi:hypothetical protein [Pedobacter sp.]
MTTDRALYKIYIPNEKAIKFDRTWLAIIVGICAFLLQLLPIEFGATTSKIFIICIFVFYITQLATRWTYKPLYGELKGELEFNLDGIIVDGYKFNLDDIANIEVNILEYYGKYVGGGRYSLSRIFSQGVKNQLSFSTVTNEFYYFNFRLENKNDYKKMEPFLDKYFNEKKMSFRSKYNAERTEIFS